MIDESDDYDANRIQRKYFNKIADLIYEMLENKVKVDPNEIKGIVEETIQEFKVNN